MPSTNDRPANMHPTDQWQSLVGAPIDVTLHGVLYRRGLVDAAMPDGSGFWLAADGPYLREFIDAASGYQVWTTHYPPSRMSMTAEIH